MRELFNRYSDWLPFDAVCGAYSRGELKQITQLEELSS